MTSHRAMSFREDLKRLTSELPPGSVRGTLERRGANELVKCMFVMKCIVIVFLCQSVKLYCCTEVHCIFNM
jgi:hypothetical protein